MFRISHILLIAIVILSFFARLYHFNAPMADLHSWRQADTAAVARNFTYDGFDILHPKILSAVSIDGLGRDNSFRYHFAEFPLYQAIVAGSSYIMGDIVTSGRVVSIVSSLISLVVLYLLTKRYYSEEVSLLASFVFGVLPYNLYWSRTILPDPMMVMFCLCSLYFFDRWIRDAQGWTINLLGFKSDLNYQFSLLFFALAMLLKAFPLFLLIPMTYLFLRKNSLSWVPSVLLTSIPVIIWNVYFEIAHTRPMKVWLWPLVFLLIGIQVFLIYRHRNYIIKLIPVIKFVLLALIPLIMWRIWMQQWPMSIPASDWLFDGKNLRLKPAWWHWIFQDRLDRLMFNFSGLFLIGVGLINHSNMLRPLTLGVDRVSEKATFFQKIFSYRLVQLLISGLRKNSGKNFSTAERKIYTEKNWFFPLCLGACLLYFIVFATGNVTHEYYQIPIIPFGAVFLSVGFWYLWETGKTFWEQALYQLIAIALVGVSLLLGWYGVREWYTIGNPMQITIGKRADLLLPKNALVIAPYGGDTTFLYYINRPGWSVVDKKLQEMIDRGATHFISNYRDEGTNRVARLYTIVEETPEYVIVDLRQKSNDPEWQSIKPYEL